MPSRTTSQVAAPPAALPTEGRSSPTPPPHGSSDTRGRCTRALREPVRGGRCARVPAAIRSVARLVKRDGSVTVLMSGSGVLRISSMSRQRPAKSRAKSVPWVRKRRTGTSRTLIRCGWAVAQLRKVSASRSGSRRDLSARRRRRSSKQKSGTPACIRIGPILRCVTRSNVSSLVRCRDRRKASPQKLCVSWSAMRPNASSKAGHKLPLW